MSSKYTYLLVPGHGGVDSNGKYTSAPNFNKNNPNTWYKSYYHQDIDLTIFEGDINRKIKDKLLATLKKNNISAIDVVPEVEDVSLAKRVERDIKLANIHKNCIHIEIHSNAASSTAANGWEIFTTKGQNNSDVVAEAIINSYLKEFKDKRARLDTSDGDKDKEANFYVIRKVPIPAILLENFFFSNPDEAQFLSSKEGQERIANAIFNGIKEIEKYEIAGLKKLYKM